MSWEEVKASLGKAASYWIEEGMVVGLGSGTTASYFIKSLGERVREGLRIRAVVATSKASFDLAESEGLFIVDLDEVAQVDLTVDGADEIDHYKRMIKGGGGAFVREKILANASQELAILVDETKYVDKLGKRRLPVEILPFGALWAQKKIEALGYKGGWRLSPQGLFVLTENGNRIFDIVFSEKLSSPEQVEQSLLQIPGIVDTGFFFQMAKRVLIGYRDGSMKSL